MAWVCMPSDTHLFRNATSASPAPPAGPGPVLEEEVEKIIAAIETLVKDASPAGEGRPEPPAACATFQSGQTSVSYKQEHAP